MGVKNPAQVPVADAQVGRQAGCRGANGVLGEPHLGVVQPPGGLLDEDVARILGGPMPVQWCQLGPAAQARAKARQLGLCGVPEKQAVFAPGVRTRHTGRQ